MRPSLQWSLDAITAPATVVDNRADLLAANLRTAAGIDPHDKGLHDLVGELSTRSDEFRHRWGAHNVRIHGTGAEHFHHHVVGDLALAYESMELRAEPGLTMTIYAAEPDSPTAQALALLASWAATAGDNRLSTSDRSRYEFLEARRKTMRIGDRAMDGRRAIKTLLRP